MKPCSNIGRLAILCALYVTGICPFVNGQQPQNPLDGNTATIEIMAVVNGQEITRQHIANECLRRFGEDILEAIVTKQLVYNECQRRGIAITEKDVNDEITRRAEAFKMSANGLIQLICTQRNMTPAQYKNDFIWKQMALRRLAADRIQVTRQEIDERMEFEFGPRVQVRQIAVNTKEKASELLASARQDPESFERLAQDHSLDLNTAPLGGLLPAIRRFSGLPEFENIAFAMQPGQISEVFQIQDKFLIIKCERIFPALTLPPNEVAIAQQRFSEQISNEKLADAATDLYKELQSKVKLVNVYNDPEMSQKMPGVAALVDNVQITKRYLAEECISHFGHEMLETEIGRSLLIQALQQANLQVGQEDITEEIRRGAESQGFVNKDGLVDQQGWLDYVTRGDASKIDFYIADVLWPTVALKKLVENNVQVTAEDMQKGFESNYGPRVSCLAIVSSDQRTAFRIWGMATSNPTQEFFGKLANQYSVEPGSQALFGQVPPIKRHIGVPELEKEAFRLKPGEISKVVQVGETWMTLFCKGRTTPVVDDPDAVKDELHKIILEKKLRLAMEVKLNTLRSTAQIDNFLAGTSQSGRNVPATASRPADGAGQPMNQR